MGRSVAVIPDLDTPESDEGMNRTLAMALGEALGVERHEGGGPGNGQEALGKTAIRGS